MTRRGRQLLVGLFGFVAAGLLECDNRPSHSPGLTTPTTPGVAIVRLEIAGPPSVPPGGTTQFTAVARLADGSSRDVTEEASWGSSNRMALTVLAGRVIGVQTGDARVSVSFNGRNANREVIVVAQDTFRIVSRHGRRLHIQPGG